MFSHNLKNKQTKQTDFFNALALISAAPSKTVDRRTALFSCVRGAAADSDWRAAAAGLSPVYCNMSTNHWLPPSVCAATRGQRTRFPIVPEGCWVTAWAESSTGLGDFFFLFFSLFFFLASQTLSAQTCAKWKQTQPRLLITIRLDLCPSIFLPETQNGRLHGALPWNVFFFFIKEEEEEEKGRGGKEAAAAAAAAPCVQGTNPCRRDNTGWHAASPSDFSNLLFHARKL